MDTKRKKELAEAYANRHPEMGIISFCCKTTGEAFLGASKDTRVGYNSNRFKLLAGGHPNKALQALWNQYGEGDFLFSVVKTLKYEDPQGDYTKKLEDMLEGCIMETPQGQRIWK